MAQGIGVAMSRSDQAQGMEGSVRYHHRPGLSSRSEAGEWWHIAHDGARAGIALDPAVGEIWWAADGSTAFEVASTAGVSTFLASCTLAVLQHAGLLLPAPVGLRPGSTPPHPPTPGRSTPTVSAIVVHRHASADVGACLAAIAGPVAEVRVLAAGPLAVDIEADAGTGGTPAQGGGPVTGVVRCEGSELTAGLIEEMGEFRGDALLVIDSDVTLAPNALQQMLRPLELCASVGAVAPRLMCRDWPAFVVGVGEWRTAAGMQANGPLPSPHAGQLDVGQFRQRWQEIPGAHFGAALLRGEAVTGVGAARQRHGADLDWLGAAWSSQARRHGYRTVGALHALAYAPWSWGGRGQHTATDGKDSAFPGTGRGEWPHLLLHTRDGVPALTVENIRSLYAHHPAITPRQVRPRVVLIGAAACSRGLAEALAATCEVSCAEDSAPDDPDPDRPPTTDRIAREDSAPPACVQCRDADVVITTAGSLETLDCLQNWPAPILLTRPSGGRGGDGPLPSSALLQMVDGVVGWSPGSRDSVPGAETEASGSTPWVMPVDVAPDRPAVPCPLADYCRRPVMAAAREIEQVLGNHALDAPPSPPTPARQLPRKAWRTLRQRGAADTAREVVRYVRWRMGA